VKHRSSGQRPHPAEDPVAPDPAAREGGEEASSAAAPGGGPGAAPAPTESAAELRDRWLRAEADLQNYRRRARLDAEEARRTGEERVMREIITALDDLDRALESAGGAPEAWLEGVRLVGQRLRESLARDGVRVIDPIGQLFDPALHEAILEMDAPQGTPPGTVVQVVLKGYARGDRALRPARVVVARAPRTGTEG